MIRDPDRSDRGTLTGKVKALQTTYFWCALSLWLQPGLGGLSSQVDSSALSASGQPQAGAVKVSLELIGPQTGLGPVSNRSRSANLELKLLALSWSGLKLVY